MKAKKSLGQNFLRDEKIVEKIIEAVSSCKDEVIVEVGPGEGVLTERLAHTGATVLAIELDDRLIPKLEKKFSNFPNVHIIHADILRINIQELLSGYGLMAHSYRLVGNLPYYITSAIIRMFLESEVPPREMFVMVQREVAERICADPGEMSILSVAVQYYANPEIVFDVPKESFEPVPKVESAFLRIVYSEQFTVNSGERREFFRIVRAGFCARRKTLLNNLSNSFHIEKDATKKWIVSTGISESARAQDLSVEEWKKLHKKNIFQIIEIPFPWSVEV